MKVSGVPSVRARSVIRRPISISLSSGGTPARDLTRRSGGISSKRFSMPATPMAASIAATSASVWGMKAISRPPLQELAIVRGRHECRAGERPRRRPQPHQPTLAVGVRVDGFRLVFELGIPRDHLAGERRIDVRRRLDRLDHRARLARLHGTPGLGHLDEHQVPERVLGVIGNADLHRTVGEGPHPFVGAGVLKIGGNGAHDGPFDQLTSDLPKRTNGSFTTRAFRSLPRTSTCTAAPVPAGIRANAMERSSVGENVPLVISPSPPPGMNTLW